MEDCRSRAIPHLQFAQSYERAASAVLQGDSGSCAFWMLIGHAFELGMKSRLLHAGADEEDLMIGVNHSLTAALKMVQRTEGGRIEGECVALIESLSRPHAMQAFRYPSLLPEADLPPPDRALRTLRHFLRTTDTRLRGWWRALRPDPP